MSAQVVHMKWKPLNTGRFKVNVDGAFKEGKIGIGIIVRDDVGDLIASMAAPANSIYDPKHLETLAVAKGIEFANDLALTSYCIELDCLEIVNRIRSKTEDLSDIGHIIHMIRQLSRYPCCLGVAHTKRMANLPTHTLAKHACNLETFGAWIEEGPNCILPAI